MSMLEAVRETNEAAKTMAWWQQRLGKDLGKVCWEVHCGRSGAALSWLRDMVNDTLTEATWSDCD